MNWFNYYGLIIIILIMLPNIAYSIKQKDGFINNYHNKAVEFTENIGRYACIILMIFNIPHTWFGFFISSGETVYITVNAVLVFAYILGWIILWKKPGVLRALLLSVIPSVIFIFSGIMIRNIPAHYIRGSFCLFTYFNFGKERAFKRTTEKG